MLRRIEQREFELAAKAGEPCLVVGKVIHRYLFNQFFSWHFGAA